jgi:hypothetical protein
MPTARHKACVIGLLATVALGACGRSATPPAGTTTPKGSKSSNPLDTDQLPELMAAHRAGLGHMERFEYADAADAFRKVHKLAPDWIPGSINLATALLNDTGLKSEEQKKNRGGAAYQSNFDEALALLNDVLKREPKNPNAHFCRGVILQYQGDIAEAHKDFVAVTEIDPSDAHAWLKRGETLTNPDKPGFPAGPKQAPELIEIYGKALERSPYLTDAIFKLSREYLKLGRRDKYKELEDRWKALNPQLNIAAPGEVTAMSYGAMGKYADVIDPFPNAAIAPRDPIVPPRFEPPVAGSVTLPSDHRWAAASDFTGKLALFGRFRERFGAAIATFDADGDDRLDLYVAAAIVGPKGVRDALLINKGEGKFEDATLAFGLPDDRASLGVAAGDFDADRRIDLFLTGIGDNRLYRNVDFKRFENVSQALPAQGPPAVSPTARWLDLDQDGDLDLYVVNYCAADQAERAFTDNPPDGLLNDAYRNDGVPPAVENVLPQNAAPVGVSTKELPGNSGLSVVFSAWNDEKSKALRGVPARHTAIAALDCDDDRDTDIVLAAARGPLMMAINDRLGTFHSLVGLETMSTAKTGKSGRLEFVSRNDRNDSLPAKTIYGLLVADLDKDGKSDLVMLEADRPTSVWLNRTAKSESGQTHIEFSSMGAGGVKLRSAIAVDLDMDSAPDLIGVSAFDRDLAPIWLRNSVTSPLIARPLALGPEPGEPKPLVGLAFADLMADPLPELILWRDGQPPLVARNLGNGHHWLAIDLGGRWEIMPKRMRTNPHGLGTKIQLQGENLSMPIEVTTPVASPAQSVGPIFLGLGRAPAVSLVRLRWPDGVMQCELNQGVDTRLALAENNRKTGSCPVLFTWNGERFVCVGDFLGGGGLGYLIAPGVVSQPDRDEAVAISGDQLKPQNGILRLSVTEPMDEVAYLDQLSLDVVDLPPGVSATPDERFAPGSNRPTGRLIAWKAEVPFVRATDLKGRDVSPQLAKQDRLTADQFRKIAAWVGYAEEHGIVLDFGDRFAKFGPNDRLVLRLDGWVEYPYSQTNYAAATAGVQLQPPILERQRSDGTWQVLESDPGYPAGLPRTTTLELTGKLGGPTCVLRLRTNMECYWDKAVMLVAEDVSPIKVTTLRPARAVLGYRGYLREGSPDGRQPFLYDYDYVDPAPLAKLSGRLTRYGDVAPLVRADDDQFCLVGPGDELHLDYESANLAELPKGWTRQFILRATGYCKDADPATVSSDSVLPLPWREMPAYPFGAERRRTPDRAYTDYLRDYQTRAVQP